MPAIEAAASGVPVVCAPVGALPEVLGEAAEWCAAPSAEAITAGLTRVLSDRRRRQELVAAGLARVAHGPTWADSGRRLGDVYEDVAQ